MSDVDFSLSQFLRAVAAREREIEAERTDPKNAKNSIYLGHLNGRLYEIHALRQLVQQNSLLKV